MNILLILTILLLSVNSQLDVNVWAEPGYYYGYNCELTFQFIANNFSSAGENIHLYTDNTIGFQNIDDNSMLILANDLKEYEFYSYECPVTNRNQSRTCFQIFGQLDNIIPAWANLLHTYNSTHKYFLARIRKAFCPVNHTITPTINVVVPASYSGVVFGSEESGVKYNKTLKVNVNNLSYRDLGWTAPKQSQYQMQCGSTFSLQWSFISPELASSWYQATLIFDNISKLQIDVTNCAPSCQIDGNSLVFTNSNHTSISKSMTGWNNEEYNMYSLESNRNNSEVQTLAFTFEFKEEALINYTFGVSSKFLYENLLPPEFQQQNITYHGYIPLSMKLLNKESYFNLKGKYLCTTNDVQIQVPETNGSSGSTFIQSLKNFMSQFSLIILGVYCLLILIVRRIPFLVQKIIYLLLCGADLPLTITCLIRQELESRAKILLIFVIVQQVISKIFFINYCLIFCRKGVLTTKVQSAGNRFKIYLMFFYNFRFCYFIYSKIPCCSKLSNVRCERRSILITHSIHLIMGAGAKLFLIIVSINYYLINIDSFQIQTMFIIVQIIIFTLTMLIIKYSLMLWRNIKAKAILAGSNTVPSSLGSGNEGIQTQTTNIQPQVMDFMQIQAGNLPTGVSEVRGLAAYENLQYEGDEVVGSNNYFCHSNSGDGKSLGSGIPGVASNSFGPMY